MTDQEAEDLIRVDEDQDDDHGQHMRDTFHLADFFIHDDDSEDKLRYSIERCLDLVFGKPDITPTFNEFAMYMAFSSALRSADLSRQVGAVIAKDKQIISSGANDCPAFNGGLYWPVFSSRKRIEDVPGGRDIVRPWPDGVEGEGVGYDSNAYEKQVIIEKVLDLLGFSGDDAAKAKLESSPISDITEYGRVVHAEMEAILSCARIGVSCVGGTIYCTTFPCHNCAKHIIASGISEVVFVEPYPKSKALEFHPDSAVLEKKEEGKVRFKPFVGVGPRRFFDLFSMSWGDGRKMKRKIGGFAVNWDSRKAMPRLMMRPDSYRALEKIAIDFVTETKERIEEGSKED
jgi:deoxycytidylate deaminase